MDKTQYSENKPGGKHFSKDVYYSQEVLKTRNEHVQEHPSFPEESNFEQSKNGIMLIV